MPIPTIVPFDITVIPKTEPLLVIPMTYFGLAEEVGKKLEDN
jgi:hypothetical protein